MQWFERCECGEYKNTEGHRCIYTDKDLMIKHLEEKLKSAMCDSEHISPVICSYERNQKRFIMMSYQKLQPRVKELHDVYIDWFLKKCCDKFNESITFGDYCDILRANGIHIE